MRIQNSCCFGGAFSALLAVVALGPAQAQSIFTYNDPTPGSSQSHRYGVLNGDLLALYINDRGDLGAPYRYVVPEKPKGISKGTKPVINNDGSVPETSGTYAALFSKTSTSGYSSLASSI